MARMHRRVLGALCALALALAPASAGAQAGWEELLDRLVGHWRMSGTVRGEPATYEMTGTRTLQGRFVELHMTDVGVPPAYEARVFIASDSLGRRLIAHWMDSFGAAYSIPHATGEVRGDTIELLFRYADGPFRDRFVYDRRADRWDFLLEAADSSGAWERFARYDVKRAARGRK